jgi:hypothetical protein
MSGKYYPNNWQEYKDAPDEMFEQHTFEDIMTWKIAGWELPSSVCCIIRVKNNKTGKIKELTYQKQSAAESKVQKLMQDADNELTVCTHESIHHVSRANFDD